MSQETKKTSRQLVTRGDLFKVFLASFFMQAVWNFRTLISIGFTACMIPVLNKLYTTPQEKCDFLKRHLKFFNSHPYFASYALGVSIKLEEMKVRGEAQAPETIDRLKDLLISPLGAIGDRLFWATIKPASLITGMAGILLAQTIPLKIGVLFITFLIYNIPHLYFRYKGIILGYRYGIDVYKHVGQQRFEKLRRIYFIILVCSTLLLVIFYGVKLALVTPALALVFVFAFIYTTFFYRLTRSFYITSFSSIIFFIVLGLLFF